MRTPAPIDIDVEVVEEIARSVEIEVRDFPQLVRYVLDREEKLGPWSVAIVLTDDARLRALHRQFMGLDSETDVMTFPYEDTSGGDILISVDRAADQAADYGHGVGDEVRFLLVHGLLHLCGWEDETDEARAAMWHRQTAIIDMYESTQRSVD
jgi:probable rRNA maturation factor